MIATNNRHELVAEFDRAWAEPGYTRAVQPPTDLNRILSERYQTSEPLRFTRTMLWDVEARKAAAPGTYIPTVVREGTDHAWDRQTLSEEVEYLVRCSQQRLWLAPDQYGLILERAHLDHAQQKVTFVGERMLTGAEGSLLHAGTVQPRFHVEHAVDGTETEPINRWRIVHLTDAVDQRLIDKFDRMWQSPWLPEFVEIYIRRDLGIELTRRSA